MKNKKGFTLVELLAVIAIIALISLIAIPNIIGLSTGIRKDNMLDDAKKMISLAKYQVEKSYDIRTLAKNDNGCIRGVSCTFKLKDLNINDDIKTDPDGGSYDMENSSVTYSINSNHDAIYCVILIGSKRSIKTDDGSCIEESVLYSRNNVRDNVDSE